MQNISVIYNQIIEQFNSDLMHQSILFYGTAGIGKTTLVNKIIYNIFKTNNLVSPDILIINDKYTADGSEKKNYGVGIDEVRHAILFATMSTTNKHKILVLDGIQNMSISATNALLKLVEEPSKGLYIFLITDKLYNIKQTLRSRCMQIRINKPSLDDFLHIISYPNSDLIAYLYVVSEGNITAVKHFLNIINNTTINIILNDFILEIFTPLLVSYIDDDIALNLLIKIILFELLKVSKNTIGIKKTRAMQHFQLLQHEYNNIISYHLNKITAINSIINHLLFD